MNRALAQTLGDRLNTDGKPHPRENALAVATLALGGVAILASLFPALHLLSSWAGLAGIIAGGWGQLISATTAERFLFVTGLLAAAVGLYVGMTQGGPFGGLLG